MLGYALQLWPGDSSFPSSPPEHSQDAPADYPTLITLHLAGVGATNSTFLAAVHNPTFITDRASQSLLTVMASSTVAGETVTHSKWWWADAHIGVVSEAMGLASAASSVASSAQRPLLVQGIGPEKSS